MDKPLKIVHIVPGSGGTFYCQNCLRDSAMVQCLRGMGHDVMIVPLYLPLFTDAPQLTEDKPVFFGGINIYLQQKIPFFRWTPRWFDRLFDHPWLLRRAAKQEGSTSAAALGDMTLSMLQGRAGHQRKEIDRLITWMVEQERPDGVYLSNALLSGLAPPLKEALDVPIVCALQDEDTWLDAMGSPYDERCWAAMSENGRSIDSFAAVSAWYADKMQGRMSVPADRVTHIPLAIELTDEPPAPLDFNPPTIGFLSRLSEGQGLGLLVDAFLELKKRPGLEQLRLKATGGITPADESFLANLRTKLEQHGVAEDVEFLTDFERPARHAFLRSLSMLSVPALRGEAFGAFILEALQFGVPVVQPDAGAFREVVENTQGGVVYTPHTVGALADALADLLLNPEHARALGQRGRDIVLRDYGMQRMARDLLRLFAGLQST
jgi:glycosyltransferase involved in cell wall biosynthesis